MRTVGVLGGMGPAATVHFLRLLVRARAGGRDQDHPPCIVYSATQVPDRTAHLVGEGPDPAPALRRAAQVLEAAGADFIVIPCNSAHAYLDAVRDAVAVPVLDMVAIAVAAVRRRRPRARSVGLLATDGTLEAGLYHRRLRQEGLAVLVPGPPLQARVMEAIRAVKGGSEGPDPGLSRVAEELVGRGAEVLLLACTELPLAFPGRRFPVVDATEELAAAAMALAVGEHRAVGAAAGAPLPGAGE